MADLFRRDFLKFNVGTSLAAMLATVGDPQRVRLATATEAERFRTPLLESTEGVVLETTMYRVGQRNQAILKLISHARGGLTWRAHDFEEGIVIDASGDRLCGLRIATEIMHS